MAALRVMVVEDNAFLLSTLQALLNRIPALSVVATARDSAEAIPLFARIQPQLLILDINSTTMDGWTLLDELHKMDSSVEVIVFSPYPEQHFKQLALDKGAIAYVVKGNTQHLLDALLSIVDRHAKP